MIAYSDAAIPRAAKNKAETDPAVGILRLRLLMPYALQRLGREDASIAGHARLSLRRDRHHLVQACGCGSKKIAEFIAKICRLGPENVRGTDLLKCAPNGGRGKMKIKGHLRQPLTDAIHQVCVVQGLKPGCRRATTAIKNALTAVGISVKDLPSRATIAFHSRQPAIYAARTARIEGEHMVRAVGENLEQLAINGCTYLDCTTFSSNDAEEDQVIALDVLDREIGIANAIFGLDAASRGVWTYLPFVGAPNTYLVGLAIRRGLLDKQVLLEKYSIEGRLPLCGKPKRISHDCGSEFIGQHTVRVLDDMDIGFVDVCPPYTPYYRGKAERFNRTAHALFAEFLRSDCAKPYFRKVPRKPKAVGIRFCELDRALLDWVVNRYHVTGHSGLNGESPLQRFERLARGGDTFHKSGYPLPVKDSPELMWDFLWQIPRTIGHTGIHLWNRRYTDPRLQQFFAIGKRSSKRKIIIGVNPYALRAVYVRLPSEYGGSEIVTIPWLPESGKYLMDANTATQATNPSRWEWDAIYADLRRVGIQPTCVEAEKLAAKREPETGPVSGAPQSRSNVPTRKDRANRAMRDQFATEVPRTSSDVDNRALKLSPRVFTLLPTGANGADEY